MVGISLEALVRKLRELITDVAYDESNDANKVSIVADPANVAGRKRIVFVDASSSTTVPAGSHETIMIQPPEGKIWRVEWMYLLSLPPTGATTGTHTFIPYSADTRFGYYGSNVYNEAVEFNRTRWTLASSKYPSDETAAFLGLSKLLSSHTYPLLVQYTNNTDADQTNPRTIKLLIEEGDEAT